MQPTIPKDDLVAQYIADLAVAAHVGGARMNRAIAADPRLSDMLLADASLQQHQIEAQRRFLAWMAIARDGGTQALKHIIANALVPDMPYTIIRVDPVTKAYVITFQFDDFGPLPIRITHDELVDLLVAATECRRETKAALS